MRHSRVVAFSLVFAFVVFGQPEGYSTGGNENEGSSVIAADNVGAVPVVTGLESKPTFAGVPGLFLHGRGFGQNVAVTFNGAVATQTSDPTPTSIAVAVPDGVLDDSEVEIVVQDMDSGLSSPPYQAESMLDYVVLFSKRSGPLRNATFNVESDALFASVVLSGMTPNAKFTIRVNGDCHCSVTSSPDGIVHLTVPPGQIGIMGDSDADCLSDDIETDTGVFVSLLDTGTDPLDPDTDGDGLLDGDEVNDLDPDTPGHQNPFDPHNPDTTGDYDPEYPETLLTRDEPDGIRDGLNDYDGDGLKNSIDGICRWPSRSPIIPAPISVAVTAVVVALLATLLGLRRLRRRARPAAR